MPQPPTQQPPHLTHRYADAFDDCVLDWRAEDAPAPEAVIINDALAADLGLDVGWLRSPAGLRFLTGQELPDDARPVALAYSGHQFGQFSPLLGDGRALLLGELSTPDGRVVDVHLKGSGPTPFARGGDGRATLDTMLREHLIGEAMHALGIPTTRALAVIATGWPVARTRVLPGAVLVRVAAGLERVGTAQFVRVHRPDSLEQFAVHCLRRHYPGTAQGDVATHLLERVIDRQARLVAAWTGVGFVHGVLNTDNTTLSGEGIDYGPCAFLEAHDPDAWFSSIDHAGRYRFGRQAPIVQWNLARLAEALLPLTDVDTATEVLSGFDGAWARARHAMWSRKLGLGDAPAGLIDSWTSVLADGRPDHTLVHRALAAADDDVVALFPGDFHERVREWLRAWRALGPDATVLRAANPVHIPRNHLVEEALAAAVDGDPGPYRRLLAAVTAPFTERPGLERYARPAPDDFGPYVTHCGT